MIRLSPGVPTSVREDLRIVLSFSKDIRFEGYWKQNILPKIRQKTMEIDKDLPKYNVIAEVEKHLGFALPSNKITIYMLYYSRPHGIKITGTRFITNVDYPFDIVRPRNDAPAIQFVARP